MTNVTEEQKTLANGYNLTPDTWADFLTRLVHHNRGEGVQDHCTAHPIFIVQSKCLIIGIDKDFDPPLVVCCEDSQWFSPREYWEDLDAQGRWRLRRKAKESIYGKPFLLLPEQEQWDVLGELDDHTVTGYQEQWEYVNAHLTPEAAEAFIRRKKHDYRELRVYVDSQYYAWEFNAIVDCMLAGHIGLVAKQQQRADALAAIDRAKQDGK